MKSSKIAMRLNSKRKHRNRERVIFNERSLCQTLSHQQPIQPGGRIRLNNGQIFEVWTVEDLVQQAQMRWAIEALENLEIWDEQSLAELSHKNQGHLAKLKPVICQLCGYKNIGNAVNCDYCGEPLKDKSKMKNKEKIKFEINNLQNLR